MQIHKDVFDSAEKEINGEITCQEVKCAFCNQSKGILSFNLKDKDAKRALMIFCEECKKPTGYMLGEFKIVQAMSYPALKNIGDELKKRGIEGHLGIVFHFPKTNENLYLGDIRCFQGNPDDNE